MSKPIVEPPTTVALFITCLVDLFRPEVGEATVALLERLGLRVVFPAGQTCCGALGFHAGWPRQATALAQRWIEVFEPCMVAGGGSCQAIVAPSATCVAMVRQEFPRLLASDPEWRRRAESLAAHTYELSEFLVTGLAVTDLGARFEGPIVYQPACQLQALGIDHQPKALLATVRGAKLMALSDADSCCGFGGLFSIKLPQISDAMGERKVSAVERSEAEVVVTCEMGCLLQLDGMLSRRKSDCRAMHLAELLAGQQPEGRSNP